jgi:hypothetical protein
LRPVPIPVETAADGGRESGDDPMHIHKDRILELLREGGDEQTVSRADRELPDPVDTERDRAVLEQLGLDPKELLQKISGEGIPELS